MEIEVARAVAFAAVGGWTAWFAFAVGRRQGRRDQARLYSGQCPRCGQHFAASGKGTIVKQDYG